ncbi:heme exporter protein CcmB [Haloplanus ruber]|uniref:Heme exporter protein CcmB n=1 Tax=Haloplanus ruber TaxID=869892 RepID=A0ABD6CTJ1_9EURY|nr:heme exporter protein CcmB [Haloplanus ruber]
MSARQYLRVVREVARKDLLLELRGKRRFNGAGVLALLIVVVFSFAFVRQVESGAVVGRGSLWIALVFGAMLALSRGIATEETNAAIEGLLLAPVDRSAVYLGKVCSATVFVTVIGWTTLVGVTIFLNAPFPPAVIGRLLVVFPLAALGFAAAGVLLTSLTLNSRLRESLLPVLLLPLVIPVVLAGMELTRATGPFLASGWFRILLVYDALVAFAGWLSFEFVVEG